MNVVFAIIILFYYHNCNIKSINKILHCFIVTDVVVIILLTLFLLLWLLLLLQPYIAGFSVLHGKTVF